MDSGFSQQGRIPKNNGLAIAGFVTSLICCAPVGLGLSIAGLMQINKDPQYQLGKGFAIAGIVLGAIGIVAGILYWGALMALLGSDI
jgi:formate-dependent nitrite reductase membrane component NrfD